MKRILPTMAAMLLFAFCGYAQKNTKNAEISFDQNMYDFGTVANGETARHDFKFINTGKKPLTISDVKAQCACTTAEWPKEPIEGGQSGIITVIYDTQISGMVAKKLTVVSNAESSTKDIAVKINVLKIAAPSTPKDSLAPNPPGN